MKKILQELSSLDSALHFFDVDGNLIDVSYITIDERRTGIDVNDLIAPESEGK